MGKNVFIRDNSRIEIVLRKHNPEVLIGDNTNIEQNFHMTCHQKIIIGKNCSIAANVVITDITHPYSTKYIGQSFANRISDEPSEVVIGDNTFIGAGCVILPNVRIGDNVVVGANSVVTKSFGDNCILGGVPAQIIDQY